MDRDGTKDGYDLTLVRAVSEAVDVPVIASGGVGEPTTWSRRSQAGADAVLCASIFHYGQYSVAEVKRHLAAAGIACGPTLAGARDRRVADEVEVRGRR